MRGAPGEQGRFLFREAAHEPGVRTVMGRRYAEGGVEQAHAVMKDLAASPHTARHVSLKLARHFVSDDPPPALVARLQASFQSSGGDLSHLARTLIDSPEAWDPAPAKFKTPYEFMISSWRAAGIAPSDLTTIAPTMTAMGQKPFSAPSPKGWPEEAAVWCAPDAVIKRMGWSEAFAQAATADRDPMMLAQNALGRQARPRLRQGHRPGRDALRRPFHPADDSGVPTPMTDLVLSRRRALAGALGLGITVEFVGGRAFAASQGAEAKKKLVVIVCRGGLDGPDAQPAGGRSELRRPARQDRGGGLRPA